MKVENTEYSEGVDTLITLRRIFENPFSKFLLKYFTKEDKLKHALEIYCKVKEPKNFRAKINAKIVGFFINRAAKTFGRKENIAEIFKKPVYLRGLNLVLKSIGEYGITRPQKLSAPFLVVWDYTNLCNLKCKHCYANAGKFANDELTTEQKYEVVDQLDKAGVVAIAFSGGEPLMRKDLFEIASYTKEKGMYASIATNGTLISKGVAKKLKKIGIDYVEISLDHVNPVIHDRFRGVRGAWKKNC
jgi:uncharacterized radical SAM superfamily Fe-S cluster-containing enzyme